MYPKVKQLNRVFIMITWHLRQSLSLLQYYNISSLYSSVFACIWLEASTAISVWISRARYLDDDDLVDRAQLYNQLLESNCNKVSLSSFISMHLNVRCCAAICSTICLLPRYASIPFWSNTSTVNCQSYFYV